jgi:glycosyltransferase involved in cell wall biosynthesis
LALRVALVHDWLNGMRGGEKVFEILCEIFPNADVFTLFYEPTRVSRLIRSMNIIESPVARVLPGARRHYRWLLPFMPKMIEAMPVKGYDLVVSTSHCVAKGALAEPASTPHICYCFTPMRYVWDKYDDYFGGRKRLSSWVMPLVRQGLQEWDFETAGRVTHFLTSSQYVRSRIREHYLREAQVLPAPVDYRRFAESERSPGDYFLVVSALEPYKKVDIAVEAFNALGLPLKVAGTGTMGHRLKAKAKRNIEFLGWMPDQQLAALYSCAKAVIFPSEEDFGIVPLEAAAAGCPVIAFDGGGALETVIEGRTGNFFPEQSGECLADAVSEFDPSRFDPEVLRRHAILFDRELFKEKLSLAIQRLASVPMGSTPPLGTAVK